jgi:hypothetical protein
MAENARVLGTIGDDFGFEESFGGLTSFGFTCGPFSGSRGLADGRPPHHVPAGLVQTRIFLVRAKRTTSYLQTRDLLRYLMPCMYSSISLRLSQAASCHCREQYSTIVQ